MSTKIISYVKSFKVSDLRKLYVPSFQRWLVESNLDELRDSVKTVGVLRSLLIARIKDKKNDYIIDGNHLRTILLENIYEEENFESKEIPCIYIEVDNLRDAAQAFQYLNTKGRKLGWVDITNLYKEVCGPVSVYYDIWMNFFGNPTKQSEVKRVRGFSHPTIIEILCPDKNKYRNGLATKDTTYHIRKELLTYLFENAPKQWDEIFAYSPRPTGAAIIGYINYWVRNGYHKKYSKEQFLDEINEIYFDNADRIKNGLIINRDNAKTFLKLQLAKKESEGEETA